MRQICYAAGGNIELTRSVRQCATAAPRNDLKCDISLFELCGIGRDANASTNPHACIPVDVLERCCETAAPRSDASPAFTCPSLGVWVCQTTAIQGGPSGLTSVAER